MQWQKWKDAALFHSSRNESNKKRYNEYRQHHGYAEDVVGATLGRIKPEEIVRTEKVELHAPDNAKTKPRRNLPEQLIVF